jgi:ribosomal protein S18 acetylase RimI-like enzyme
MSDQEPEYREVTSSADPAYSEWKRIYLASFPEEERMSLAYFDGILSNEAADSHMVVQMYQDKVTGIAYYESKSEVGACYLWYIAIDSEQRAHGLGTRFYEEIVHRADRDSAKLLIFEVEIPQTDSDEAAIRIGWYRRLGAYLLTGIHYVQTVDSGDAPIPMYLMVHPVTLITPEDAFQTASALFEDAVHQTGPLGLD